MHFYHDFHLLIEKFKKNLKEVIDSFEKAREWADLSNCLQKVKRQFEQHSNTEIPLKKDLAKRLGKASHHYIKYSLMPQSRSCCDPSVDIRDLRVDIPTLNCKTQLL